MSIAGRALASAWAAASGRERAIRQAQQRLDKLAAGGCRFLIAIPYLKSGGAERVAANLAQAFVDLHGPQSVAILVTDWSGLTVRVAFPENHAVRYPADVPVVDIIALRGASFWERTLSLTAALTEMQPELVINVNSRAMWECYDRFGADLAKHTRLGTVDFAHVQDRDGKPVGYAVTHFERALPSLDFVLTDNHAIIARRKQELGPTDIAKYHCLYQPTKPNGKVVAKLGAKRRQILWASRVTRVKTPELLPRIARLLPDYDIHAYGSREIGYRYPRIKGLLFPDYDLGNAVAKASNLTWHGGFKAFADLPLERFDAFLYTSLYDGIPNVLLEAGAHQLPIVAPMIGGIGELISEETGWPVRNPYDAREYAERLREAMEVPAEAVARADALASLIAQRHSFQTFCRSVSELVTACQGSIRLRPAAPLPRPAACAAHRL
jgi:glycosyltransferase involved in cell wall biosynthesis